MRWRCTLLNGWHAATAEHVQHGDWIDAKEVAGDERDDNSADNPFGHRPDVSRHHLELP